MLAYPIGRLETRVDRVAIAVLAIGVTALNVLYSTSLTLIADKSSGLYGGLALAVMTSAVVLRRWLVAPARSRRELLPVLVAGIVFLAALITNIVRRIVDVPDDVDALLVAANSLAPAAIPIALLIGFYRQSEHRLEALVDAIPDRMFRFTRDGALSGCAGREYGRAAAGSDDVIGRRLGNLMFAIRARGTGPPVATLDTGEFRTYLFSLDLPGGRRDFEAASHPAGPTR